jgi:hypothetical protein
MSARQPPVTLTDARAVTAAGQGVAAALAAVTTGTRASRRHPTLSVVNGDEPARVYHAPVWHEHTAVERGIALIDGLAGIDDEPAAEPADTVWLVQPQRPLPDALGASRQQLGDRVATAFGSAVQWAPTASGAVPVLTELRRALIERRLQSAWLVAVQSLVGSDRIRDMGDQYPIQTQGSEGMIPGEGAVALRLTAEAAEPGPRIRGLASRDEGQEQPAGPRMSGLANAIQAAVSEAGCELNRITHCYSDATGDTASELEWWQTINQLWPTQLPDDQRRAVELGLLTPRSLDSPAPQRRQLSQTLGYTSVAGALLQLALAWRGRRWDSRWAEAELAPAPGPALVTEHPLAAYRHAVLMD